MSVVLTRCAIGLAQDERGNGQQEADVHAEVHDQRLVDAARQIRPL
jgi:hypothetical protein